jgi:imidazolonepropionase-like amidohydrolase
MSQFRVLSLGGVVVAGFVALVASFIILEGKTSTSTLYCVSNPSSSHITTLNSSIPRAKCFRVKDGIFTDIMEDIPKTNDEEIKYLDGFVLPGLIDSHGHILQYGEMLESVLLYGAGSVAEVGNS